jgi:hypothetical protein
MTTLTITFGLVSQSLYSIETEISLTLPPTLVVEDLSLQECPYTSEGFLDIALCSLTSNVLVIQQGLNSSCSDVELSLPLQLPFSTATTDAFTMTIKN